MSATITPQEEIAGLIAKSGDRPPRKCHRVDDRGWAYCRNFGPSHDKHGNIDRSGTHSQAQCVARGHRSCQVCEELVRQFGDHDGLMAG